MSRRLPFDFNGGMSNILDVKNMADSKCELIRNMTMQKNGSWKAISMAELLELPINAEYAPDGVFKNWSKIFQWFPTYVPEGCIDTYVFAVFYDDGTMSLVWRGTEGATIILTEASLDFVTYVNVRSGVQSYTVTGYYLDDPIVITPPTITNAMITPSPSPSVADFIPYWIRLSGSTEWVQQISLVPDINGMISANIDVSFLPVITGDGFDGNLTHVSGTATENTALTGYSYGEPSLTATPDELTMGAAVNGLSTALYVLTGVRLPSNVIITTPSIVIGEETVTPYWIRVQGTETWVHTLEITVTPYSDLTETIEVKFAPLAAGTGYDGSITNVSGFLSADVELTGTSVEFPYQQDLLWWLEAFDESEVPMMAEVDDEILTWQSILPSISFQPYPDTGRVPNIPAATLRPVAQAAHLRSADIDDIVSLLTYEPPVTGDSYGTSHNVCAPLGTIAALTGFSFVCVFNMNEAEMSNTLSHVLFGYTGHVLGGGTYHDSFYMAILGTNYTSPTRIEYDKILMSISHTTIGGGTSFYRTVTLSTEGAGDLKDAGWCVFIGSYNPSGYLLKVYLATETTIYEFDEVALTGTGGNITNNLETIHASIGCLLTVGGASPRTSCECVQATNLALRRQLTEDDVKDILAYYKIKYPNLFDYDPESIT